MKVTKNTLNRGLDADQESLIVMEQMACNVCHNSNDAKEGVAAFLEKRDPGLDRDLNRSSLRIQRRRSLDRRLCGPHQRAVR